MYAKKTAVFFGLVLLAGCASSSVTVLQEEAFQSSMITSLACMPFVKGRRCSEAPSGGNSLLDCRLSAINYPIEFYSDGAALEVSSVLHEELSKKYGRVVAANSAGMGVYKRLRSNNPHSTLRVLAVAFARELGVEYVMVSILERYIDRVGRASSVERPASVGFRLYLLHAPTKSVVFEGSFDETQQSLSENALKVMSFFKRGARWLTAEELSRAGITAILADIR